MKKVFIQQPSYLPWIGYFEQIYGSDIYVFFDDVQYTKNSWKNRNRIKTANGIIWLSVPVHYEYVNQKIMDIRIDYSSNWVLKHLKTIETSYRRAKFFSEIFPIIERNLKSKPKFLVELDINLILDFCQYLGLNREFIRSSSLGLGELKNEFKLIEICNKLGVNHIYNGANAKNILNVELIKDAGIEIEFQNFQHPIYPQLFGEFVPYLSIIDLLFNCGPESSNYIWGHE